ncbi:MAG: leucine-rich repeat domain-containing protein [Clostridium sp.]|nr:leucine-rich repeat domain-containing protein [Clostridium sp.]
MKMLQKIQAWQAYIFLFLCAVVCSPVCAQAAGAGTDQEVTIYGLDSADQKKLTIPGNLPQSYQINIGNGAKVSYRIESGDSAKVSANGLITPQYTYWKRNSGFSSSVPEGEAYDYYTISAGDTQIVATAAGKTYRITVHVKDYAIIYCDGVMEDYLSQNVKADMTDYELMQAVARFPASYDYSVSSSGVYSMILNGGGDCWASTSAIVTLCEKLGIKAWSRNGNRDPGAGSGHMNAMAELNGVYYELEAGYAMSKNAQGYRPYDVTVRKSLFSYYGYSNTDGLTIYQYDGYEKTGVLKVPESIEGKTVTKLDKSAFSSTKFSEIQLPDTLTDIGDYAFSSCSNLTHIEIPASVTSIGSSIFSNCKGLTDISIASGNENYQVINQAIYSKDGKTLVTCPTAGQITIPDTVTEIADYAFYYNENIRRITIPESVTALGEGAFGNCSGLSDVTMEGNNLTTVGNHCFRNDGSLLLVRLPASVETLGAYAFGNCNKLKYVYFMGDAPAFGDTVEDTFYDEVFYYCTANAYYPEGNATWTTDVRTAHGGTMEWLAWSGTSPDSMENATISLEKNSYTYNRSYIRPAVTVTLNGKTLTLDEDYIVDYTDNFNAGTAAVTVMGIGSYQGAVVTDFTIEKAKGEVTAYTGKSRILEQDTTSISSVRVGGSYFTGDNCTYTSNNPSVAAIDEKGIISGISAGTAVITVQVGETANYLAGSTTFTITVTHDLSVEPVDGTVSDGKIKMNCPRCNKMFTATVPTDFEVYWSLNNDGWLTSYCGSNYKVGDVLGCYCYDVSDADLDEMEIVSQDSSVVTVTDNRYLNFIADGIVKVEVRPKYNPSIGKVYTFYVGSAASGREDQEQNGSGEDPENGQQSYYDQKTGITVSVAKGKKNATLTAVDPKHAKGSLVIPATLKIGGTKYTITAIGKAAFKNNQKITKVTIGSKVKKIGSSAFSGCKNLKTVKLGANVTQIGDQAFYNCKKITGITIPSKVNKIGKKAFYNCKKLKKITIKTSKLTAKKVGSKAFTGIPSKAVIKVPKKKLKAYKTLLRKKGVGKKASIKK